MTGKPTDKHMHRLTHSETDRCLLICIFLKTQHQTEQLELKARGFLVNKQLALFAVVCADQTFLKSSFLLALLIFLNGCLNFE